MKTVKSNYELTIEGIEAGAASILIDLEGGNIVVKHGTDGTVLKEIKNAEAGSWDKLWEGIDSIKSVK